MTSDMSKGRYSWTICSLPTSADSERSLWVPLEFGESAWSSVRPTAWEPCLLATLSTMMNGGCDNVTGRIDKSDPGRLALYLKKWKVKIKREIKRESTFGGIWDFMSYNIMTNHPIVAGRRRTIEILTCWQRKRSSSRRCRNEWWHRSSVLCVQIRGEVLTQGRDCVYVPLKSNVKLEFVLKQ